MSLLDDLKAKAAQVKESAEALGAAGSLAGKFSDLAGFAKKAIQDPVKELTETAAEVTTIGKAALTNDMARSAVVGMGVKAGEKALENIVGGKGASEIISKMPQDLTKNIGNTVAKMPLNVLENVPSDFKTLPNPAEAIKDIANKSSKTLVEGSKAVITDDTVKSVVSVASTGAKQASAAIASMTGSQEVGAVMNSAIDVMAGLANSLKGSDVQQLVSSIGNTLQSMGVQQGSQIVSAANSAASQALPMVLGKGADQALG